MKLSSQFNIRTNKRKAKDIDYSKKQFQCFVCYQFKALDDFHSDSSKVSGRSSKCKKCANLMGSMRKAYKRQGYSPSDSYYMALDLIRGEIISAKKDTSQRNSYRQAAIYKYAPKK